MSLTLSVWVLAFVTLLQPTLNAYFQAKNIKMEAKLKLDLIHEEARIRRESIAELRSSVDGVREAVKTEQP